MEEGGDISTIIRQWINMMCNTRHPNLLEAENNETIIDDGEVWIADTINNDGDKIIVNAVINGVKLTQDDLYKQINGEGGLTFENGDYFDGIFEGSLTDRKGVLTRLSQGGAITYGTWRNGNLEGLVDIEIKEGGWRRSFYHKGVLHGLTREFRGSYNEIQIPKINRVAFYSNGETVGDVWQGLEGEAFIIGPLDYETNQISGRNVIYLYPDLKTSIRGRFERAKLIDGRVCQICDTSVDEKTKILNLVSTSILAADYPKYKNDYSTNYTISKTPLIPDLWESSRVEVRSSSIESELAGDGLFAKILIAKGQIVSLFNGIRRLAARNNSYDYEEDITFEYRIRLNAEFDLDIPKNFRDLSNYCATLGHKANHSFQPNARWSRVEHPRFGLICSIVALRDICPNEEIYVNYGIGMADAPTWYKQLWVQHLRNIKHQSDDQINDWCGRQYAMKGKVITLPM